MGGGVYLWRLDSADELLPVVLGCDDAAEVATELLDVGNRAVHDRVGVRTRRRGEGQSPLGPDQVRDVGAGHHGGDHGGTRDAG